MNLKKSEFIFILILVLSEKLNWQIFYVIMLIVNCMFILKYGILKKIFSLTKELIFILIIGAFVGIFYIMIGKYTLNDYFRDIIITSAPILYISIAFYLNKVNSLKEINFYRSYVYSGVIISIIHLFSILQDIDKFSQNINNRNITGNGSSLTIVAIIILIFIAKKKKYEIIKSEFLRITILVILMSSLILYFSRTDIVLLISFLLVFILIRKKINFKAIVKGTIVFFVAVTMIVNVVPQNLTNQFMAKFSNSFKEISSKSDIWSWEKINNDWRGYEIYQTKKELKRGNVFNKFFGYGFGKKIELDIQIKLGEEIFSNIPILHNGYYYLLCKIGGVGLVLYLIFLIKVISFSIKKILKENDKFKYQLMCGATVGLVFSTYVVAGMYNKGSTVAYCFLLGYLYSKDVEKQKLDEDEVD